MRTIKGDPIKPLQPRRPSRLVYNKAGEMVAPTGGAYTDKEYEEMGGREFISKWMNSPQYKRMMRGKEMIEVPAGKSGIGSATYSQIAGDSSVHKNRRILSKDITTEGLYEQLKKWGYGDNPTITSMRKKNLENTKRFVAPGLLDRDGVIAQAFSKDGRPAIKVDEQYVRESNITPELDNPLKISAIDTHEYSHATDARLPNLNTLDSHHHQNLEDLLYGSDSILIPREDSKMMGIFVRDNRNDAEDRRERGEELSNFDKALLGRTPRQYYLANDTESRARLNTLRKVAGETGIYDPFTERFTPEHYDRLVNMAKERRKLTLPRAAKEINSPASKIRRANQNIEGNFTPLIDLQEIYTKDQIIKMMNSIAQNKGDSLPGNYA